MISEEKFIGNRKIVNYLNRSLEKGYVSHAYIFEGPEGVGKTTLALHFAAAMLGEEFESMQKSPDLFFISAVEDESQISVESIRELQKNLSLYPYKSKYKVAIIENAHLMNHMAANALLKTLEEPTETSVLILTSSDSGKLLDTLRSRCQVITFSVAKKEELERFMRSTGRTKNMKSILELADGKPARAINLVDNDGLLRETKEAKAKILGLIGADNFKKMDGAGSIGMLDKKETAKILDVWTETLRGEMIRAVRTDDDKRTAKLKKSVERIIATKEEILNTNVNVKLAIENLCLSF